MIINQKKVKQIIKDAGKQCGKEYLEQLEYKVLAVIKRSIANSRHFKRLGSADLL